MGFTRFKERKYIFWSQQDWNIDTFAFGIPWRKNLFTHKILTWWRGLEAKTKDLNEFFFCLSPLCLATELNVNVSKTAYCWKDSLPLYASCEPICDGFANKPRRKIVLVANISWNEQQTKLEMNTDMFKDVLYVFVRSLCTLVLQFLAVPWKINTGQLLVSICVMIWMFWSFYYSKVL